MFVQEDSLDICDVVNPKALTELKSIDVFIL